MNLGYESEVLEFKKSTGELKEAIISLGSMLNKHGYGTVYFGVKNDGTIIGQQIADSTLRDISRAVFNCIKPQVIPTIVMELIDELNIIKVYVEGNDVPYSVNGKYYIRSADEDLELSPKLLTSFIKQHDDSDKLVRQIAHRQDLNFETLKLILNLRGVKINENKFNENMRLVNDVGVYKTSTRTHHPLKMVGDEL